MQFTSTILKLAALASVVLAESEMCNIDHSGRKEHCTIQFKTDGESLAKFAEVANYLRGMKCSWIGASDITVNPAAGSVTSDLPAGFVDAVFNKLPQYAVYVQSKSCN